MTTQTRTATNAGMTPAQIAVLVAAALQIVTPLMPALGIGEPIGARSDAVRTIITPAGWAFSIWGALYVGSVVFAVFQARVAQRDSALLHAIRWPAAGAFLGNAVWAAYTQVAGLSAISVAIIACTLLCLLVIYRRFAVADGFTPGERWCAYLPLSALAAWLTVATTVNIAASLRFHGVEAGAAAPLIGAGVLVAAGLIGGAALVRGRGNLPYAAVFLWALAAIYAAGGQEEGVIAAGTGAAAMLIVGGLIAGWRRPARAVLSTV